MYDELDDPNLRYGFKQFLIDSISSADTFCNMFNNSNHYKNDNDKLQVGDLILINDGVYNTHWQIVGFNLEHNRKAFDNTIYDNGYGIALMPLTSLANVSFNASNSNNGGYKASDIHTAHLPNIVSQLKNVLGNHIVNRNVLLSNGIGSDGLSNSWSWTYSDATLVTIGQISGNFCNHRTIYDEGEASYIIPLFSFKNFRINVECWTRGISSSNMSISIANNKTENDVGVRRSVLDKLGIRPLIYIR